MSGNTNRWCVVPECSSSRTTTPQKLWIQIPNDTNIRNKWLKLANRDPESLSTKTRGYFCEDHFDLENDMENYLKLKLMGSVKRIRMKTNCVPSRFDCQSTKHKSTINEPLQASKLSNIKKEPIEDTTQNKENVKTLPSCSQEIQSKNDKAVQAVPSIDYKCTQVYHLIKFRSKYVQTDPSISAEYKDTGPKKRAKSQPFFVDCHQLSTENLSHPPSKKKKDTSLLNGYAQIISPPQSSYELRNQPSDDDQIFADYVASELRKLSKEGNKKLRRLIQRDIVNVQDEEDALYLAAVVVKIETE